MKLVAPGVPSGRPATTMTRWPGSANRSLNAIRQARSTISFSSRASSSMTQWMPQTTDNFRPAASIGEIATIGHFGRSRDTRSPVEPEQVNDRSEIEGLGDLARRSGDRIGAGAFRLGVQD